jgi:hypothetical protein
VPKRPHRTSAWALSRASAYGQVVKLPRAVAVPLAALIVAGACGSTAVSPSPSPSGSTVVRCAPTDNGAATAYPGWPAAGEPQVIPILISSELAIGPNRFLFNVTDTANKLLPRDVTIATRFFDLAGDPTKPKVDTTALYIPTSADRGLYRADVTFGCAGDWGVELSVHQTGTADRSVRGIFQVRETTATPPIGSTMPAFDTPTLKPGDDIKTITTDTTPDPDFYRTSVRQALADKRPFLLVLATPAFCKTATCGPALDLIQAAAGPFKDKVTFIQVEPYVMAFRDGSLQPVLGPTCDAQAPAEKVCDLQAIPMVDQLRLVTEPYTFAVDRTGTVVGKFEGVMGRDELDTVLALISK